MCYITLHSQDQRGGSKRYVSTCSVVGAPTWSVLAEQDRGWRGSDVMSERLTPRYPNRPLPGNFIIEVHFSECS